MEHSIQHSREPITMQNEPCSPKKCATCFENHGCMLDQYMAGSSYNVVDQQSQQKANSVNPKLIQSVWAISVTC